MSTAISRVLIPMHAGSSMETDALDGPLTKIEQGYQMVAVTQVLQ